MKYNQIIIIDAVGMKLPILLPLPPAALLYCRRAVQEQEQNKIIISASCACGRTVPTLPQGTHRILSNPLPSSPFLLRSSPSLFFFIRIGPATDSKYPLLPYKYSPEPIANPRDLLHRH